MLNITFVIGAITDLMMKVDIYQSHQIIVGKFVKTVMKADVVLSIIAPCGLLYQFVNYEQNDSTL